MTGCNERILAAVAELRKAHDEEERLLAAWRAAKKEFCPERTAWYKNRGVIREARVKLLIEADPREANHL